MHKIAVIGDADSILCFKAVGMETVPAGDAAQAAAALRELAEAGYAVILLTEQYAAPLSAELASYAEQPAPAVILIPGEGGSQGIALAAVKDAVERAVGADIL